MFRHFADQCIFLGGCATTIAEALERVFAVAG